MSKLSIAKETSYRNMVCADGEQGEFDNPTDVAINFQRTELLYVADTDNNRIQYCNLVDRIFYIMAGSRLVGVNEEDDIDAEIEFDLPGGVSVGRNGEVCVVDTGNHRFILFNPDGIRMLMRGGFGGARQQFRDPTDLVADPHGNIYIVDSGNHRIKKYDFSGNLVQIWGTEGEVHGAISRTTSHRHRPLGVSLCDRPGKSEGSSLHKGRGGCDDIWG